MQKRLVVKRWMYNVFRLGTFLFAALFCVSVYAKMWDVAASHAFFFLLEAGLWFFARPERAAER